MNASSVCVCDAYKQYAKAQKKKKTQIAHT